MEHNIVIHAGLPILKNIDNQVNKVLKMIFIKEYSGYYFEKKKLFSKSGREIKQTVLNYTKGYWLGKKFLTINKLKGLTFYREVCPF
jgi:hypothetical protein